MKLYNEKGGLVNCNAEIVEQNLVKKYVKPDDRVLELGARYGSVSIVTNKIVKDKSSHYVVEPDSEVWNCLEKNMELNDCKFNIIKGVISKKKYRLEGHGYSRRTVIDSSYGKSQVQCYEIPKKNFNVLIVDCEGFFETFYNENKSFFKDLETIIFESDEPERCNYDYLLNQFSNLGFKVIECIEEPTCKNMFHYVLKK